MGPKRFRIRPSPIYHHLLKLLQHPDLSSSHVTLTPNTQNRAQQPKTQRIDRHLSSFQQVRSPPHKNISKYFCGYPFCSWSNCSPALHAVPCCSSSPWIMGRCQAMEVILSFTASASLADSSGNYVQSFKAASSSASWVCCFWLVAVSSHLPCPSFWLNVALKIWELDHSHFPLIRSKNKQ